MTNDQKNKADSGKVQTRLLFYGMPNALNHVAGVLSYGAQKYRPHGWKEVDPERYVDAAFRHDLKDAMGELYDDESGLLHLAHRACNSLFLLEMKLKELGYPDPQWNPPPQDHKK